jgi:energy-coupling factor transport system ATP-binding protein
LNQGFSAPEAPDEIIRIEHMTYEYKREGDQAAYVAVNDVSLSIERGSFVAIIGRNGSGKSTLAKCINALLLPASGKVYVNGWDTTDEARLWQIRQTAGMVFQNPDNQLVSSIVEDDVAFGPENLGIDPPEIRRRVDRSLSAVNMFEERTKAPHLLSGGQKQRIAIAGVVAMKPECIIFDEPTAMLDPNGRAEVMKIIERLNREGITILLITHFMDEAVRADRVVIMDDGRIAMDGTPEMIFAHSDELRRLDMTVPFTVDLADRLRRNDIPVPQSTIHIQEMVDFLCQYKSEI